MERTRAHPLEIQLAILSLAKEVERWDERHPAGTKDSGEAVGGRFMSKDEHLVTKDNPIRQLKTAEAQRLANDLSFVETPEQLDEAITKRIAYLDPQEVEGGVDRSEKTQWALDFLDSKGLEVSTVLNDPSTGFNAYGISSKDKKEQKLVFTGSNDEKDWEQNKHDSEVGRTQFEANRKQIKDFLVRSLKESGRKAQVTGHSLGGALAQITVSEFPELISAATIYNSASITKDTAKKFAAAQEEGKAPIVTMYYHAADPVPGLKGEAIINGDLQVFKPEGMKAVKIEDAHMDLMSDPKNKLKKIKPPYAFRRRVVSST